MTTKTPQLLLFAVLSTALLPGRLDARNNNNQHRHHRSSTASSSGSSNRPAELGAADDDATISLYDQPPAQQQAVVVPQLNSFSSQHSGNHVHHGTSNGEAASDNGNRWSNESVYNVKILLNAYDS